jgi:hypothetical protein
MENEDRITNEVYGLLSELQIVASSAVSIYEPISSDIILGKVKSEAETRRLLDLMLDLCYNDDILDLFKKTLQGLSNRSPRLVKDYVKAFYGTWGITTREAGII